MTGRREAMAVSDRDALDAEGPPRTAGSLRCDPNGRDPLAGPDAPRRSARDATLLSALGAADVIVALVLLRLGDAIGTGLAGVLVLVPLGALTLLTLSCAGAYRPSAWLREHPIEMLGGLAVAATVLAWAVVMLATVTGARWHAGALVGTWLVLPLAWYAARRIAGFLWRRLRPERILIVGGGEVAARVARFARSAGGHVVGCLDEGEVPPVGVAVLGAIDTLPEQLVERAIDRVVIAFSARRDSETLAVLRACSHFEGTVDIVPRFFDFLGPTATMYSTHGLPMLSVPGRRVTHGRAFVKRTLDVAGAAVLLLVLSPLLALIALAIVLDSGRPVLFRQRRIGLHGEPFVIFKFRTLVPAPRSSPLEPRGLELTAEAIALHVERAKREAVGRATRIGALLRRTSLDELPQLLNVLRGDMSLVGPRPLSPLEDAALEGWELLRREVRPGITGLWQVSGRSEVSWEERISLDYRQVRHWSLYSDMRVLADTVAAVFQQRGAE
jgi:exopolysaccharide biosynthesis polyprenyl glycosylphosphotransferase